MLKGGAGGGGTNDVSESRQFLPLLRRPQCLLWGWQNYATFIRKEGRKSKELWPPSRFFAIVEIEWNSSTLVGLLFSTAQWSTLVHCELEDIFLVKKLVSNFPTVSSTIALEGPIYYTRGPFCAESFFYPDPDNFFAPCVCLNSYFSFMYCFIVCFLAPGSL